VESRQGLCLPEQVILLIQLDGDGGTQAWP
jgi:hypothetical protein